MLGVSFETGLLIVYCVLILLPWVGGLALTVVQFWVIMWRLAGLQSENERLKGQIAALHEEKMKLELNLQQTLIENAVLATRRGGNEGEDSTG